LTGGVTLRRLTIIFATAAFCLVPSVSLGSTQRVGFIHDVKVFHVTGAGSRPAPAVLTILVGGKGIGKLVTGRNGHGKRFTIAGVIGGTVAQVRQTGSDGRRTLDVAQVCRNNPTSRYFIRASAVINGTHRTAWVQNECDWVVQVLEHDSMGVNRTTFFFDG
jgi:hypothetical protein